MAATNNYYGYVHMTDIVQSTIAGFRTITYEDRQEPQVNLVTRVNKKIVSDR